MRITAGVQRIDAFLLTQTRNKNSQLSFRPWRVFEERNGNSLPGGRRVE
jgi:hypothetical protein